MKNLRTLTKLLKYSRIHTANKTLLKLTFLVHNWLETVVLHCIFVSLGTHLFFSLVLDSVCDRNIFPSPFSYFIYNLYIVRTRDNFLGDECTCSFDTH